VQALDAALGQTELLQQQVQRSGLLSSESMKDRLGECMIDAFWFSLVACMAQMLLIWQPSVPAVVGKDAHHTALCLMLLHAP
jgi:hypothetical protein